MNVPRVILSREDGEGPVNRARCTGPSRSAALRMTPRLYDQNQVRSSANEENFESFRMDIVCGGSGPVCDGLSEETETGHAAGSSRRQHASAGSRGTSGACRDQG